MVADFFLQMWNKSDLNRGYISSILMVSNTPEFLFFKEYVNVAFEKHVADAAAEEYKVT